MTRLRHLIERRPAAAAWLLLLAIALRLIVPAGFMPAAAAHGITLVACPESGGAQTLAAHHAAHQRTGHSEPHRHAESPCAFAGLALPTLAAGDLPPLSPPADTVALAATPLERALRLAAADRLRPPTHAPPALA